MQLELSDSEQNNYNANGDYDPIILLWNLDTNEQDSYRLSQVTEWFTVDSNGNSVGSMGASDAHIVTVFIGESTYLYYLNNDDEDEATGRYLYSLADGYDSEQDSEELEGDNDQ